MNDNGFAEVLKASNKAEELAEKKKLDARKAGIILQEVVKAKQLLKDVSEGKYKDIGIPGTKET